MLDPIFTPIFAAALTEAGIATTVTVASVTFSIPAILTAATIVAASIGIALLLAPRPSAQAAQLPLKQTMPPIVEGTGETRLAPAYALYLGYGGISYDVLAVHAGRIGGFISWYLNDDEVSLDGSGFVIPPAGTGDNRYVNQTIKIEYRLGHSTEATYSSIVARVPAGVWTNDHRGDDTASMAITCAGVKADRLSQVYPNNLPLPTVRANLSPVWDGRAGHDPDVLSTWIDYSGWDTGTTYAKGDYATLAGAVYRSRNDANIGNNPSTALDQWVRLDTNPVLGLLWNIAWSKSGLNLPFDTFINPAIDRLMAEADKCDVLVSRKDLDVEPRFTCSTWWNGETDPIDQIADYLVACDGWIGIGNDGALALTVGAYEAPTCAPITDDYIVGEFSPDFAVPEEERVDILTTSFTSPLHQYRQVPGETWPTAADTGKAVPFGPKGVQAHSQLRRLSKPQWWRANAPIRGTMKLHLGGLQWLGKRWIPVQLSFLPEMNNCIIEVRKFTRDFAARQCSIDFVVIDPAVAYAWDPATEEGTAPPVPEQVTALAIPVPQNIGATLVGNATDGFSFTVTFAASDRTDLTYVLRYRTVDDGTGNPGPWVELQTADVDDDEVTITLSTPVVQAALGYVIEAAAIGPATNRSDWSDAVIVYAVLPSLDYSKPQNSGNLLLLQY